jgi:hypothetical protein
MTPDAYRDILDRCGGRLEIIERRERWRLLQRWRECDAAGLHSAKGNMSVFAEDISWSMAFTHEGLGPYFSRAEWITEQLQGATGCLQPVRGRRRRRGTG